MRFLFCSAVLAAALAQAGAALAAQTPAPSPVFDPPVAASEEVATLSGGCFWGVQGVFQHVKGVHQVVAGYTGGAAATAQYEIVSTGTTGHAESVQITFDPRVVSYGQILRIYVSAATDPTELNYQGPDQGTQYRSEIWYGKDDQQQKIATDYLAQLSAAKIYDAPIVTRVDPVQPFYPAEDYHQNYLTLHPDNPYIAYNDIPKVQALQAEFPQFYTAQPVLLKLASGN